MTSTAEAVPIDDFTIGTPYTFEESIVPDGYLPLPDSEDGFELEVDSHGILHLSHAERYQMVSVSGGVVTVKNEKTSVDIAKVDIADATKLLPGAHIQILAPDER